MGRDGTQAVGDPAAQEQLWRLVSGDAANVDECGVELATQLLDGLALVTSRGASFEQRKVDSDTDQSLLGTVVKVALDALALEADRVECPDPSLTKLLLECQFSRGESDERADAQDEGHELEPEPQAEEQ